MSAKKKTIHKGGKPYRIYVCERCGNPIRKKLRICPFCKLVRIKGQNHERR